MSKDLAPTDPTVKIPAAVAAAAARADSIHQQIYSPPPAEESEEKDAPVGETSDETASQADAHQQEAISSAPEGETKEDTDVPTQKAGENWEHRYKSLKGRFDSQDQRIRDMADMISQLQRELAQRPTETETREEREERLRLLTPEEENDYGQEFLSVVGKRAKEELTPEVQALQKKIEALEAKLAGVGGYVKQDARSRMMSEMDTQLPEWRALNENDDFLRWLRLPDLYSGAIRQELLDAAFERNDGPRVLAFFRGFLSEEAALAPASTGIKPDQEQRSPKIPLESLAAPGRAKSAAATTAPATEKPFFTRAQISKFFADVAAGRYRGKEAEKDRIENQIFEAQRENRVQ